MRDSGVCTFGYSLHSNLAPGYLKLAVDAHLLLVNVENSHVCLSQTKAGLVW